MLKQGVLFLLTFLLMTGLPSRLSAQTNVNGNQSGVWGLAGSPYVLTGDVTVADGDTLRIDPGVEIRFSGFWET